jgi:hypothetical protein
MSKIISKIHYNWHMVGEDGATTGQDYEIDIIGDKNRYTGLIVKKITEHAAKGEGDKWFYDIEMEDGTEIRIFNPNMVFTSNL